MFEVDLSSSQYTVAFWKNGKLSQLKLIQQCYVYVLVDRSREVTFHKPLDRVIS